MNDASAVNKFQSLQNLVGQFLDAFGGDRGEYRIGRVHESDEGRQAPAREDQQAGDRHGEVAGRAGAGVDLGQPDVAEVQFVPEVRQGVLGGDMRAASSRAWETCLRSASSM